MLKLIFSFLIFPGFLFSAVTGLMAGWLDRKVTARIQYRVGPPWYQNFVDLVKLFGKETIVPRGSGIVFLLSPLVGFSSVILLVNILGFIVLAPSSGFNGDLIMVVYLLIIPAISIMIGASSSRNPLASVGASREMKLVLSYELPFILAIIAIMIKSGWSMRIGVIMEHQVLFGSNIASISGFLAFLAAIFSMQAKLGLVPFDASEAEQEIMGGVFIEYSGLPLAVFKLTKAMLLYIMPLLLVILFLGKDLSPLFLAGKYIMLVVIIILLKNTNPRLRIDQALSFFWGKVSIIAGAAVILALMGK